MPMKHSISITVIILAVAAAFGWQGRRQLASVRATHDRLVEEAHALGIATGAAETGKGGVRTRHHERPDKVAAAMATAREFIALAREMEESDQLGGQPDHESMKRIVDFMDRLLSLDASQMKLVIEEFNAASDLKDETRRQFLTISIMMLANDHPRAALDVITESSDLAPLANQFLGGALTNWAKTDPFGALEWIRANKETHPDLVTDDAMTHVIAGAATQDPALAFQLLGELDESNRHLGVSMITQAASTPEQRSATLAALRKYAEKTHSGEILKQGIRNLTFDSRNKIGFEASAAWIESANLTTEELAFATQHMHNRVKTSDSGQWIEWLAASGLPEEVSKERTYDLALEWTGKDYQAAGSWLANAPDSPQKHAAVSAYATKVNRYEPEIAIQWLQTLPPGDDRDKALGNIHRSMPRGTEAEKAAAETFAREHGLKN